MSKRITDKQRLNWVLTRVIVYPDDSIIIDLFPSTTACSDIEVRVRNIDAAIRAKEVKP